LEESPKSFWGDPNPIDPAEVWVTQYDEDGTRAEAEIIRLAQRNGLPLPVADTMELWEVAAACGVGWIETLAERDTREINERQEKYWEETQEQRMKIMAEAAERRRERKRRR